MIIKKTALSFDDVSIVDGYSEISSRSNVALRQRDFRLPIVTASMDSVTNYKVAVAMQEVGGMFIHHRYCSVEQRIEICECIQEYIDCVRSPFPAPPYGVAIGLNETLAEIGDILATGCGVLSLDVAAANNKHVIRRISNVLLLKQNYKFDLVVGNFSDPSFVTSLLNEGLLNRIDYLKVSQGGGSACTTRINIGVGVPTFQAVLDLNEKLDLVYPAGRHRAPRIIADGGVKTPGDIVKALGAGAHLVMLGSMLAGHDESPGQLWEGPDGPYKVFRGMASAPAKEDAGMLVRHVEGVSGRVPARGPIRDTLSHIGESIRSGIATAGFDDIYDFIGNATFVKLTHAGRAESLPHIHSVGK